jgi:hypothetical protein
MKTNNLMNEELLRMKSLVNYQKGKVISEQLLDSTKFGNMDWTNNFSPKSYDSFSDFYNQGPLVNCDGRNSVTMDIPTTNGQKTFQSKTGLDPKEPINWQFYCSVQRMDQYLSEHGLVSAPGSVSAPSSQPSAPKGPTIPSELKNSEGVKKFQDWLDKYKTDSQLGDGKGWATGYTGGALNKGKGYGNFGTRTTNAWKQYKSIYLNPDKAPEIYASTDGVDVGDGVDNNQTPKTGNAGKNVVIGKDMKTYDLNDPAQKDAYLKLQFSGIPYKPITPISSTPAAANTNLASAPKQDDNDDHI